MSSDFIVMHCAPTLSGVKVGNLVTQAYSSREELYDFINAQDELLRRKGVRIMLMRVSEKQALIYVYRQKQLASLLSRDSVQQFLSGFGYRDFSPAACLGLLKSRLLLSDFPQEIGVFLGYPLADIQAFIDNKGANCPLTGYWKAYTNIDRAQLIFSLYRRCTASCRKRYAKGTDILRLTAAG